MALQIVKGVECIVLSWRPDHSLWWASARSGCKAIAFYGLRYVLLCASNISGYSPRRQKACHHGHTGTGNRWSWCWDSAWQSFRDASNWTRESQPSLPMWVRVPILHLKHLKELDLPGHIVKEVTISSLWIPHQTWPKLNIKYNMIQHNQTTIRRTDIYKYPRAPNWRPSTFIELVKPPQKWLMPSANILVSCSTSLHQLVRIRYPISVILLAAFLKTVQCGWIFSPPNRCWLQLIARGCSLLGELYWIIKGDHGLLKVATNCKQLTTCYPVHN